MKFPHQPLRFLATLALCMVIFALPLLSPASRAQAQEGNWVDGGYAEELEAARTDGSVSQSPYTARSFDTPMYRTIEHILGPVPGITVTYDVWQRNPQYAQTMLQKSAVAGIGNYIAMIYANPPADLALWIQDTGQTLGFLPRQAHAQGVGFSGLAPLLPIWKAFRNIAYLLLAIVMIVIGFMVMLRKKIDPKTVVTVQNAIPRIVITLLLITFSYAIVGIMIDLMYLSIVLATALVKSTGYLPALSPPIEQTITTGGLWSGVGKALFPSGLDFQDLTWDLLGWNWWVAIGGTVVGGILGFLVGNVPGAIVGGLGAGFGAPILVSLLLSLALLFIFIRLFVLFLSAYVNILLSLIVGPIQLLTEAIPGSSGFSSWFKNLLANIAVFPIAAVMFLLSIYFSTVADKVQGNIWTPPYYSLLGASVRSVSAFFSIGILMVIPSIVNSLKEAIKTKPPIPVSPGSLFAPITGATQTVMGTASQFYYGAGIYETIKRMRKKE